MNELIQMLMLKTGMPQEKATAAVELVLEYLRNKLPPSLASQFDHLLEGDGHDVGRRGGWNS